MANATTPVIQINEGNVGIGTTSPATTLEVMGAIPAANRTVPLDILTITGEGGNLPYTGSGGGIVFKNRTYTYGLLKSARIRSYIDSDSGSNRGAGLVFEVTDLNQTYNPSLFLKYNGNVGIGTTSPGNKLTVATAQGTTFSDAFIGLKATSTTDTTGRTAISLATSTVNNYGVTLNGIRNGSTSGEPRFGINMHNNSAGGLEALSVRASGKVGIGTTNPGQKLDVAGIVKHQGLDMTAGVQVDQITSYTKALNGTANTWRSTGIDYTDISNSGSYLVQVYNNDHSGAGPSNYTWFWTGTMSWFASGTNNATTSEIYLNGCGHHTNIVFELRTKVNYNNAPTPYSELEWKSNTSFVNSPNWIFKFRRLI